VYVLPAYRSKGVFKALFKHVQALAQESGARELRLYVERDNVQAQKVYAAMGMTHSHYDMWEIVV
jgi:ribosomal protein S18 acetylase RimI-like enzyme